MLDVELTFRMIKVLQQRRPGDSCSPLKMELFHGHMKQAKRIMRSGVEMAKDAKIAKMHVFVHFA